jgi:ferredoxin
MNGPSSLPETTADGKARAAARAQLRFDDVTPTSVVEFVSRGRCLVVGPEERALAVARRAGEGLACTVASPGPGKPSAVNAEGVTVIRGGRLIVRGALGDFRVSLAGEAGERNLGALLSPPAERFDLVVDLGDAPLMHQAMPPLGYFAPRDDAALEAVVATLPDMLGEFEKPKFFDYDAEICAHGRSGKRGCTRCIDACPAEAIVSIGESVQVNPYLCQGGGACATTCPTGAITYAYPPAADLLGLLRRALLAYREAGGSAPIVLFHDESAQEALSGALAGMPERMIPVPVEESASVGMDAWLCALAYGAGAVAVATSDRTPAQSLESLQDQLLTARSLLAGMGYDESAVTLVNVDQTEAALAAFTRLPGEPARPPATFAAPADKRGRVRMGLQHLYAHAPAPRRMIALHQGAPFGEVKVDAQACTLCMSCVSSCPTHALQDGRGLPQLNFREWSCVQCGLCERTCPEGAVTLSPRFLYDVEAREQPRLLHEEQPLCCVSCGKPFATRSMLEVLERKLAGHWMFQDEASRRRLQMCEDCRVRDLFAAEARQRQGDPGRKQ